jgi:hypothetical protein
MAGKIDARTGFSDRRDASPCFRDTTSATRRMRISGRQTVKCALRVRSACASGDRIGEFGVCWTRLAKKDYRDGPGHDD